MIRAIVFREDGHLDELVLVDAVGLRRASCEIRLDIYERVVSHDVAVRVRMDDAIVVAEYLGRVQDQVIPEDGPVEIVRVVEAAHCSGVIWHLVHVTRLLGALEHRVGDELERLVYCGHQSPPPKRQRDKAL